MSSFRVERQRVSFFSQAEVVQSSATSALPDDSLDRERKALIREKENAMHTQKYAKQMLEDSRKEAEEILSKARHEAVKLMNEAREQAEQLRQQEKERGYQEGWQKAQLAGEQWKAAEQDKLKQLSDALEAQYQSRVDEVEHDAAELAMEITEKIIGIHLEKTDTAFLNVIHSAMSRFRHNENIIVHLSNEDYRRYAGEDGIARMDGVKGPKVVLERDESLRKGDCVLETENQFVDCSVSAQLDRVGRILQGVGEEEQAHEKGFAKIQGSLAQN